MNLGIIGTGYVGLVTGACFAEFGFNVVCVDRDEAKITKLKSGEIPFFEPQLQDLVRRHQAKGRLTFSTNTADAVRGRQAVFIAVGTPQGDDGSADLRYVEAVAREIAGVMDSHVVVVIKSTVPVGTGERVREIIAGRVKEGVEFDVASNPEFLREGSAVEDFMRPNRVVIGAESERARTIMKEMYRPLYLLETPVVVTNIRTAELIKYAANCFLATKISFINEMANLCEAVGADVNMVAIAMGLDRRIGPKFLHPGPGYGGSCFPKDTHALLHIASQHGYDFRIMRAVTGVNAAQPGRMSDRIRRSFDTLAGKRIAVLGLSFKPNTDDIREAPALSIMRDLMAGGASIRAYDPVAMDNARAELPGVEFAADAYAAADGADALVLVTEWNEFRSLDLAEIRRRLKHPVFFDLRNVYDPARMREMGFTYYSVGRAV